ncbi:MAG: putative porin [Verrucomicrobiales bacterium]|nr:putative porin [Verrucomicrobiales bacterium]
MINKHLKQGAFFVGTLASVFHPTSAQAQSQDALLDKLVTKGILTQTEAAELRDEADDGFRKSYQAKSGMPDWVTSLKFNGDLRGRYESFIQDQANTIDRNRYRYRLRFGFVATMLDNIEVGFRLGSGDASATGGLIDPISNNQSLENNGAKKGIFIDLAYGKWTPINNQHWQGGIVAGKMENPFVTSDMVFDNDYTPEGAAMNLKYSFNDQHALRFIGGGFVLDEASGRGKNPYLAAAQARFESTYGERQQLQTSFGVGVFSISNDQLLTTNSVANLNVGNSHKPVTGGAPTYGFNPIVVDAAITYSLSEFPGYAGKFPIKLAADYLHNPSADTDEDGYSVGLTFGKSGKRKTWEVSYRWRELQANAWFEELVDSDTGAFYRSAFPGSGRGSGYQAGTNVRGHVLRAAYSPFDSFTLGVNYFMMEAIRENPVGTGSSIGRLQVDAILKF